MSPEPAAERLYILACDHRASFRRSLFGEVLLSPGLVSRVQDAKAIVLEGLQWSLANGADRASAGLLIDTETSARLAARAKRAAISLTIPVERGGGGPVFDFDHGDAFGEHITRHDPDYAKALVRYNPDGDPEANALMRTRLRRLATWAGAHRRALMVELMVDPTPDQLSAVAGDAGRYDTELRPGLTVRAIAELRAAGMSPRVWKLEGLDDEAHCRRVAAQVQDGLAPGSVWCVVLGRGAGWDQVRAWLATAAVVPEYRGFAVGRTLWMEPLRAYVAGHADRAATAERIGRGYLELVRVFQRAREGVR
jgi:myo-inositol catabolism protein IolC